MILLVHRPEILPIDVGIQLGGRDIRMAKHFLDGAKVGAAFDSYRFDHSARMRSRSFAIQPKSFFTMRPSPSVG